MRKKKFVYNTVSAIFNQIVTIICGFILPRQILLHYGSNVNGLVSSITNFLGIITLLDLGVGAVVQSSLYKPLSEKDTSKISNILFESKIFFDRIGLILILYTCLLMLFFPLAISSEIGFLSTAFLVFSIALTNITQYFFGITNQLLLNADQKSYIPLLINSLTIVLNTIVSVILINLNFSITIVKLISASVILLRPFLLYIYVKKHYNLNRVKNVKKTNLKQKWDAVTQHIATFVVDKTDVVVLTLFSTLKNVSIYYVYHLVVSGLYQAILVLTTGLQALFGDMYAKNEREKLKNTHEYFEWIFHNLIVLLFSCTFILIIPFVKIYTKGVDDTNYILPVFSGILTIAIAFCSLRSFYGILIKSIGHFKETQTGAIVEAIINIVISIIFVNFYGLIGVAIGTLIAMIYRTLYLISYIGKYILVRNNRFVVKLFFVDLLICAIICLCFINVDILANSYYSWALSAVFTFGIIFTIIIVINIIFYFTYVQKTWQHFKTILLNIKYKKEIS